MYKNGRRKTGKRNMSKKDGEEIQKKKYSEEIQNIIINLRRNTVNCSTGPGRAVLDAARSQTTAQKSAEAPKQHGAASGLQRCLGAEQHRRGARGCRDGDPIEATWSLFRKSEALYRGRSGASARSHLVASLNMLSTNQNAPFAHFRRRTARPPRRSQRASRTSQASSR